MIVVGDEAGPGAILAGLSAAHRRELDAAATILALAADWADLHPAVDVDAAAYVLDTCTGERLPIAGDGAPSVDGLSVVQFAAALDRSTGSGLVVLGDALELRHRLPSLWDAVLRGSVPAWKARKVAALTRSLSREAAAFVDRQLVVVAGSLGLGRIVKLVDAAIAEFMPEVAEAQRVAAAERRRFDIDFDGGTDGLASVSGRLDVADALDLDAAITDRAAQLGGEGWEESVNVRRSVAAGDLARNQAALDYRPPAAADTDIETDTVKRGRGRGRQVVLYVHVSEEALTGASGLARLQNLDRPVLTGQVQDWCGRPGTQITVKPVIDLRDTVAVDQYEVPDRIAERVGLRDQRCVFPWCDSTRGDADHIVPYARGGPTSTDNLGLLCRKHHRAKTHTRWLYRMVRPGLYLWSSPSGHRWLRDAYGTHRLD